MGRCFIFTCMALVYSATFLVQPVDSAYNVFEEQFHCVAHGAMQMNCPEGTAIVIQDAIVYKSTIPADRGVCPWRHYSSSTQYCKVGDVSTDIMVTCASKNFTHQPWVSLCTYDPSTATLDEQTCAPGLKSQPYIVVKYLCEAKFLPTTDNTSALAMEIRTPQSFQGSKVHIDSEAIWISVNNGTAQLSYIYSESKVCCIHVPAQTEMIIYPYIFVKDPAQSGASICKQRIEIWEGGVGGSYYPFCSQTTVPKIYPPRSYDQVYGVTYQTEDNSVGVVFVINAQVSYRATFRMECGITMSDCKGPTTVSPTSTAVFTTENEETTHAKETVVTSKNDLLPVIIGSVLAAVLILIIVLIILLTRYRGEDKTEYEESEMEGTAYVTGMYLEGDQMSHLYVSRKQDPVNILYANTNNNYIPTPMTSQW